MSITNPYTGDSLAYEQYEQVWTACEDKSLEYLQGALEGYADIINGDFNWMTISKAMFRSDVTTDYIEQTYDQI